MIAPAVLCLRQGGWEVRGGMRTIELLRPGRVVFGCGCAGRCAADLAGRGAQRVFLVASRSLAGPAGELSAALRRAGLTARSYAGLAGEPTVEAFQAARLAARDFAADAYLGLGGGSVMDVAKLLAGLAGDDADVREAFGAGRLRRRGALLACLPSTAGTGSEVSPIAVLTDTEERLKKGVVSEHLVPDAAYVDPMLTLTVPPAVTAATGMDALTHCVEAFTNRNAHPCVDLYALEGIRLIGANLARAVEDGGDVEARSAMALASLYGGLCLGPVGVAAVHALAYPLGGQFGLSHGVSNALLLPHVMAFSLSAAPRRYAAVAIALGAPPAGSPEQIARGGVERVAELSRRCGVPARLSALGVPPAALGQMAQAAMQVTRLLKNNPRDLSAADAEAIYRAAY